MRVTRLALLRSCSSVQLALERRKPPKELRRAGGEERTHELSTVQAHLGWVVCLLDHAGDADLLAGSAAGGRFADVPGRPILAEAVTQQLVPWGRLQRRRRLTRSHLDCPSPADLGAARTRLR